MPECKKIRKKKRQICLGDMRDRITLEDRDLTAPLSGVDASETFTNPRLRWAMIETVTGVTFFNDVGIEVDVTHIVYIRFESDVTAQTWVKLTNGQRLKILDVENIDERSEFQKLRCTNRGQDVKEATDA